MMVLQKIYLDYNATAPAYPEVMRCMVEVAARPCNASSIHGFGREARRLLDTARQQVMHTLDADGTQIIFTASGTEANNLAIYGLEEADTVLVSAIEHPSVLKPAERHNATIIPVDQHGLVNLEALERLLKQTEGQALVSVMLANNETGVIQPVKEIAALVYEYGGFMHCDAAQAIGKIPVSFNDLNVDMMTISGHKIGAGQGAAALIVKKGLHLHAQITGGGQESGYRAGTENVAAIAGMGIALEKTMSFPESQRDSRGISLQQEDRPRIKDSGDDVKTLRDYLEDEIQDYAPDAMIFGQEVQRLPNTSCIAMPGMTSETQLINFDLAGIAVSSGSACSSGRVSVSHVLIAMGVEKALAQTAIRVSIGATTTKEEINIFLTVWKRNYDKTKQAKAA